MSGAADKLARSRSAIIDQIHRRDGRKNDRETNPEGGPGHRSMEEDYGNGPAGWFGHIKKIFSVWWRQHPASLGVELATPALSAYAGRKPVQFLAIAATVGAVAMLARPWRLISLTGLVVALIKSSQLSRVMSAVSAIDFRKDHSQRR
jgi:hypothetical protein